MNSEARAASVRAELSKLAKERGADMQLLLLRYANERVLYRLSQSPFSTDFILKGAMLFHYWSDEMHRATRDIDLLGHGESSEERLRLVFQQVLRSGSVDDGLEFQLDTLYCPYS